MLGRRQSEERLSNDRVLARAELHQVRRIIPQLLHTDDSPRIPGVLSACNLDGIIVLEGYAGNRSTREKVVLLIV